MTPLRWTASLSFSWTPILTFTRRRADLLDWFEANVEVVGFTDDSNHVGIAAGSPYERLVVHRQGMRLELLSGTATGAGLEAALAGVLSVLEPSDPMPGVYSGAWSVEIPDSDYDSVRKALAIRASGVMLPVTSTSADDAALLPTDAAVLFDLQSSEGRAQVEFGIVSAAELTTRLSEPHLGRLIDRIDDRRPGGATRSPVTVTDVPDVSLFVDIVWQSNERVEVESSAEMLELLSATEERCRELVATLKRNL